MLTNVSQKVWVYNARTLELVNGKPFISKGGGEAARFGSALLKTVIYFMDNWKPVPREKALYASLASSASSEFLSLVGH